MRDFPGSLFFEGGRGRRGHGFGPGGHGHGRRGGFFDRLGGFGGPGMRAAKMLAAGDLQLVILVLLTERPRHGYEIIKALEEKSSGIYTPSPGVIYPALTYLEEVGMASCATEGTKKLYTITAEGEAYLESHRSDADATLDHLARFGEKMARFQKQFIQDENAAEDFGRGDARDKRADWREIKAQFRDVRDELKAALFEKFDASFEEKERVLDVLRRAIAEIRRK